MGMGGSVDDIWEKLKASSAPSQHALKAKRLLRGVHAGESTSRGAPSQSSRSASQGTGRGTTAARGDGQDGSREPPSAPSTSEPTPEPEAVSPSPANFADLEDLERGLARDLNSLADTQAPASTRLRSLRVLRGVIDTLDANLLREASLVSFAKPLLRRFEDASEQCREEATDAFTALTIRMESAVDLLPYAVPVLRTRAGPAVPEGKDPKEPSEEVRAKLHHLLVNLLTKGPDECEYFAPEAVDILEFAVEDSHADVAVLACESLEVLVRHLGRRLAPVSKNLAWMFFPNLTHRRAKVRVATLRAIRGLMHCGAHETILDLVAFQHPNLVPVKAFYGDDQKVNYFGKLATDGSVQVRCEFVRVIGDWMTTLIERLDHESRLLPYVISALTDEADVVQKEAMDLMDRLGVQYEKEHEKDLKKLMYYMPEAFGEDLYGVGEDALTLPPPFTKRPRLGSRILIKNNFKSVVNPVIGEMSSWQIELRAKAAVLLRTMLVFLEDNALQHVSHLCDAFISASKDDAVVREVKECCKLVGRFVRPGDWMGPLLERLRGSSFNDTAGRVGALAVLAGCLSGAAKDAMEERDEQGSERSNCDDVLEALEDRSISGSADTKLRIQLCELVSACAREKPATWRSRGSRLCALAIRAGGGEIGARDGSAAHMESAVAALATACGHASGADLIGSIRSELIAPLRSLPAFGWRAPDVAVLAAAAEAPGKCTPADAADLVRLSSLVARASTRRGGALATPGVSLCIPRATLRAARGWGRAAPARRRASSGGHRARRVVHRRGARRRGRGPGSGQLQRRRRAGSRVARRASRRLHPRVRGGAGQRSLRRGERLGTSRRARGCDGTPRGGGSCVTRASITARRPERGREGVRVPHVGGGRGDVAPRRVPRRPSRASAAPRRRGGLRGGRGHAGGDRVASIRESRRRAREWTVIRRFEVAR